MRILHFTSDNSYEVFTDRNTYTYISEGCKHTAFNRRILHIETPHYLQTEFISLWGRSCVFSLFVCVWIAPNHLSDGKSSGSRVAASLINKVSLPFLLFYLFLYN